MYKNDQRAYLLPGSVSLIGKEHKSTNSREGGRKRNGTSCKTRRGIAQVSNIAQGRKDDLQLGKGVREGCTEKVACQLVLDIKVNIQTFPRNSVF